MLLYICLSLAVSIFNFEFEPFYEKLYVKWYKYSQRFFLRKVNYTGFKVVPYLWKSPFFVREYTVDLWYDLEENKNKAVHSFRTVRFIWYNLLGSFALTGLFYYLTISLLF